jgi:hypothetical protein
MPSVAEAPPGLKAFLFHGVEFHETGDTQARGDCPLCTREGRFFANVDTGLWDCKKCAAHGNPLTFLDQLWRESLLTTTEGDYEELRESRGLLSAETPKAWGAARSCLSGEWLMPAFGPEGKFHQLYRYAGPDGEGRYRLYLTPGVWGEGKAHGLFGAQVSREVSANVSTVYVTEGPWDGMAFWEALRIAKHGDGGTLQVTGAPDASLWAEADVVAAPGCSVFPEHWTPLFGGKRVPLLYDNDHPKRICKKCRKASPASAPCPLCGGTEGKLCSPAAWEGMKKASSVLARGETPPSEIAYLSWGEEGKDHNPRVADGCDVRDWLMGASDEAHRVLLLNGILDRIRPIPGDWLAGRSAEARKKGDPGLDMKPCHSWKVLRNSWLKAFKWTEGLDRALSVMFASVISTMAVGDQLWVKVIGPAACLDGETPIYDPVDGTNYTVAERQRAGERFFVYTRKSGGRLGISQALPPQKFAAEPMYEVRFSSGRRITVTGGHRFWDGRSYVSLSSVADALRRSGVYRLPTISGTDLSARRPGAPRSTRTAVGSRCGCLPSACSCDELLHRGEGNVPDAPPSQAGAPGSTPGIADALPGLGRGRTRRCLHSVLLSSSRSSPPDPSPGTEVGSEPRQPSDGDDRLLCSSSSVERTPTGSVPLSTDQLVSSRRPLPSGTSGRLLLLPGSERPWSWSSETLEGTRSESVRVGSIRRPADASGPPPLPTGDASPPDGIEPRPPSALAGEVSDRSGGSSGSRRTCAPPDTVQRPGGDDPDSLDARHFLLERVDVGLGRSILPEVDEVVSVEYVGDREYYDFSVPETQNYWACDLFHHNCGKSTLCEALSVNKKYVAAKSTIRGFHSGFKSEKSGSEDNSLLETLRGKTLVTKDGDTLLQSPNLGQILSEARDIYDRVSRTHYRNKMGKDYEGVSLTWLLCGTSSLRTLDNSELGERFLDCVIAEDVDEDVERDIGHRVALRALREIALVADGKMETRDGPEMVEAKRLTGGYVEYLRENASRLLGGVYMPPDMIEQCERLGEFVAYFRARPSVKQDENAEREMSFRLISQHVRLAVCLAAVLNRDQVDEEVMRRVKRVAMDTSRGRTLKIAGVLYRHGESGLDDRQVVLLTGESDEAARKLLKFMGKIGSAEKFGYQMTAHLRPTPRWRLTERVRLLYREVMSYGEEAVEVDGRGEGPEGRGQADRAAQGHQGRQGPSR